MFWEIPVKNTSSFSAFYIKRIQILVDVKICVALQSNASVFSFDMLIPLYYFNELCVIAAPH